MSEFFRRFTARNWGAPWHAIIVFSITQLVITHFDVVSFDDVVMRIYTPVALFTAVAYELTQFQNSGVNWRDATEDMLLNIFGFCAAAYPTFFHFQEPLFIPAAVAAFGLVVLDAGHGGSDSGLVSGATVEKDVTLETALTLGALLAERGVPCKLTRDADHDLSTAERLAIIAADPPALFVSLHCRHGFRGYERGTCVLFGRLRDYELAKAIYAAAVLSVGRQTEHTSLQYTNDEILTSGAPGFVVLIDYIGGTNNDQLRKPAFLKSTLARLADEIAAQVSSTAPPPALDRPRDKRKGKGKRNGTLPV